MAQQSRQELRRYLSHFATLEKSLNGQAKSPIHAVRKDAIARFAELGFPTTRDEEWKYTDTRPLVEAEFQPAFVYNVDGITKDEIRRLTFGDTGWNRIVVVNGRYAEELSSLLSVPSRVTVSGLAEALQQEPGRVLQHLTRYAPYGNHAFTALSTAFIQDGSYVVIPDGVVLEDPIHIMMVSTDLGTEVVTHPRNLIVLGKNSQATIVESYVSLANRAYFTNTVTEVALGENAVLEHEKIQLEHGQAFHVSSIHVHQERNSNYISNSLAFGGEFVRNEIVPVLDGEGANATLNGLYVGTGKQLIDNHTTIDHAKPHCTSHELYKGILDDHSRGVFNGKIFVRKDAQKTDAKQTNKNLILSDQASVDTKPQLEIFANDVKCTHGATIGQLDEDAMFYLRARGISVDKARDMLIYAFASDVIGRISVESLHGALQDIVRRKLEETRQQPE